MAFCSTPGSARVFCRSTLRSQVPGGLLLEFRGDLKFNSSASGTKETAHHVTSGNSALLGLVRGNESQVEKVEGAAIQIHPRPCAQGGGGACQAPCLPSAVPPPCEPSCFAKDSCTCRRPFFILDRSAFVCDLGEEGPGISQALRKSGAHKYKPKSQVLLPAGITCHHGISYDQRGQRGKLLPQTPPVAGARRS